MTWRHVPRHKADWSHPLSVFEKISKLRKLLSNGYGLASLSSHRFPPMGTELRLSHKALSGLFPEGVIFRLVKTSDVGQNAVENTSKPRRCRFVRRLAVSSSPFLKESEALFQNDGEAKRRVCACVFVFLKSYGFLHERCRRGAQVREERRRT